MNMKLKIIAALLGCILCHTGLHAALTVEECVEMATARYPAIRRYDVIARINAIELSDINKSWLPRIGVYGQASWQNAVPSFPEALAGVLENFGQEIRGMGHLQYKAGVDVAQTVWDGGASRARREVSRAREAVDRAGLDVELYQVRRRVESLFFAILLTEEQIAQSQVSRGLLADNLARLQSMHRNGVAMQADLDMVEAQMLTVDRSITEARSAAAGYRRALELFVGRSLEGESLALPDAAMPADTVAARPELTLFERRAGYDEAAHRLADVARMPTVGLFAQGYYGYPGFNYFSSIMSRDMSFNLMAGVKVAWNIDAFYTRRNLTKKLAASKAAIDADRATFLFDNRLTAATQSETIAGLREMMKDDARIVTLRQNVRRAAESQLANGVIDVTALLTKISDENMARLTSKFHEIRLIQEIYNLKYTLDR